MNVVNWFEIPVADMQRAKTFYSEVLGCKLEDMPSPIPGMQMASFPMEQNAPNATGALVKAEGGKPNEVLMPKTPIGQWGFIARVVDSEGNAIGLHSEK